MQQVVNYTAKLWFGQRVTATVRIQKVGRSSMTLAFEVYGHAHPNSPGGPAAHGTLTTAHVPSGSVSAQPWPERIRQAAGVAVPNSPGL